MGNVLQLKDRPLAFSFSAQRYTDMLKQVARIPESFTDYMRALEKVWRVLNLLD